MLRAHVVRVHLAAQRELHITASAGIGGINAAADSRIFGGAWIVKTAIVKLDIKFQIGIWREKVWHIFVTDEETADDVKRHINNATPFGATVTIKSIEFETIKES